MPPINRRRFLTQSAALGCSAAASPLLTPIALAAAPGEARLVVIVLRGGMDGLDVVRPYGDPDFAALRPKLAADRAKSHDLDGFFAAHPALDRLMPLWSQGQLAFVQAVSTPYRDKRSHFDGQDILEAGTPGLPGTRQDGWLNRLLQSMPDTEAKTAFAIGRDTMRVLSGSAPVANWSPDASLTLGPQTARLLELMYHDDPVFRDTIAEAMDLSGALRSQAASFEPENMMQQMQATQRDMRQNGQEASVASFAAEQLRGATRIAAFSVNGWDTHAKQAQGISRALERISDVILTLRDELGPIWQNTTVMAMTEFGRTVRENGTQGTDHGTGGAMILAGGAIRGGQVFGRWPGLSEGDLYERRDLLPTADVRSYAAWTLRELFGADVANLETSVFPGLSMGDNPRLIL
ncbi:DUF1501 domain-containing protein [Pseudaestuariivita rosea]|uniref:DUF1501 domain-containing protein n=1 Tax=Pseudaestuariivita rosea TaxID=2763263 RepID=UPI001ABB76BB|nr:DUF1501 domain-containing protein [Pseudaestuariivita rosea]